MTSNSGEPELPVGVFVLLRELIRERLGFWFENEKRELLAAKLADRIRVAGASSYLDYFYLLKYGPTSEVEWDELTDVLSVQETYFWREIEQVRVLTDVLLPQHQAAGGGPVRIWCAACATGEEPLTIAMALLEGGWFERADVQIYASDASPAALIKATRGIYRPRAFRSFPEALKSKYFVPVEENWQVRPEVLARVSYRQANLLDTADIAFMATSSFIFCRNVFIYFSVATVSRIVNEFAQRMPRPGYLFVGVSESLLRATTKFELEEIAGAFVYVKR